MEQWKEMPLPEFGGQMIDIIMDINNKNERKKINRNNSVINQTPQVFIHNLFIPHLSTFTSELLEMLTFLFFIISF